MHQTKPLNDEFKHFDLSHFALQTKKQQVKKGRQIIMRLFSSLSEISKTRLPSLATTCRYVFLVA